MVKNQRLFLLFFLGLALLALILVASSLPGLRFEAGEPFPLSALLQPMPMPPPQFASPSPTNPAVGIIARLVVWILLPLSIVYAIVSPEMRRELRRILPIILLLLILVMMLREPEPREGAIEPAGVANSQAADLAQLTPPDYVTDPPAWLLTSLNIIVFIVVAVMAFALWRRFQRRAEDPQARIILEAEKALADLQSGANLKDTIMRCYADMSRVLAESRNVERHRGMTPREFEGYLAALGLRDDHIRRLTRLFEGVRYGPDSPSRREELEAVDCLNAIVNAYGKTA
jgi:hypothetical protein